MRRLILTAALLSACQTLPAHANDLEGAWQNEGGSVLIIQVAQDGRLNGRYCSELGRVEPDQCDPLTGWLTGDVVGFSVRFDPPGSVTSWSGQLSEDDDGKFLRTLWNLSRDIPEEAEDERLWESVISGYAVFRPLPETPSTD